MVNRINPKRDGELDKLTRHDAAAALNYISENLSTSRSKDNPRIDDLILSLANAHENRRARQVTEWEEMRRYCARPGL
jgi:hypothetical protein